MSSHLLQCSFQTQNICLRLYHAIFYLGLDFIFFFFFFFKNTFVIYLFPPLHYLLQSQTNCFDIKSN